MVSLQYEKMIGRVEKLFTVVVSVWGIVRIIFVRPQLIVFGTDTIGRHAYDPRMAMVYEWLDTQGISYANLVHVTPHGRVVRHWFQRHRPVVYLEGLEYIHRSLLVRFLRHSHALQIWAIDDYRNWPKVIVAARTAGLRSVLFQHGRFTSHQPYLAFTGIALEQVPMPDLYIVWNEYWRSKLLDVSPVFRRHPDVLRVGGKPSADTAISRGHRVASGGKLRVMLLHEPAAPSEEIRAFVDRLAELKDVELIYKVRGNQSLQSQLAHHGLGDRMRTNRWVVTSTLVSCDLVLGSYSTLLYEVIAAGVPVGVVRFSSMQADDLVHDELAAYVHLQDSDLSDELQGVAMISEDELSRRAGVLAVSSDIRDTLKTLLTS